MKRKMKCIYSFESGQQLTNNKIYEITKEDKCYYYTINDNGDFTYFDKNRFEEIEEEIKMSNKDKLLNELEKIKNQQKELANKLENIQKQIENEDNKNEWWIPKNEEYYYYINNGNATGTIFDSVLDNSRIQSLNYFKTKEQAERQAFEELLHRKLERFVIENHAIVDWGNDNGKYNIWYDFQLASLDIGCIEEARDFGQVYFSSEEIAEKAIEEFKYDLIRYFTSDK